MTSDEQTAAERAAEVLRLQVAEGRLRPGTQLNEERIARAVGVSRNTLRESFRLLVHDGLVVHRLHRGVFVAEPDAAALVDLYRLRRALECGVLRSLVVLDDAGLATLHGEVVASTEAAARGDWAAVGTANMRFHEALVALAGSRRMDRVARQLLAELRLAFHVVANPRLLHEPYVGRNEELLALLEQGSFGQAADELERYLWESERQLLEAYQVTPAR